MSGVSSSKTIVLVEDNSADAFLIRMALANRGITADLIHYNDVPEALLGIMDEDKPVPDAILLDLNLPKMHGITLLQTLRASQRLAHVPVAILTSSYSPHDREGAMRIANQYIHKPTDLHEFLQQVGAAVEELLATPQASRAAD